MATVRFTLEKEHDPGAVKAAFNEASEEIKRMIKEASDEAERKRLNWGKVSWSIQGVNFFIRVAEERETFVGPLAQKFGLKVWKIKTNRRQVSKKGGVRMSKKGKKLFPGPYMEKGSRGPAVAVLQLFLIGGDISAMLSGDGAKIKITGIFDEATETALATFQEVHRIDADGKFGPLTRAKIEEYFGLNFNDIAAGIFTGETVTVPPDKWPD